MPWRVIDGGFAYNEGSLNFTLRGGAFRDEDGDGVPDGVSFKNGRPVFVNIENLRDFHFDVPRGYLIVNGNEYKLVDLDGNNDNGEELHLESENVGFPEGTDRTNPAAYRQIDEHQFTYNEGSLNFTLTGGAFHDDDGDGIPDGVRIIGPKPCFGPGFDTSVENFHFKVPSGALIVNGQNYQLAELDGNPDNGYELLIPENDNATGWTKIDGGFAYRRPADNNPTNVGGLKLFGANIVDSNGDGEPDGVIVPTIRIGEMIDGVRVTRIGIEGLSGEVFLNNPQYSIGVTGDDNYGIEITKHNGDLVEYRLSHISPNATVKINNAATVIESDGRGTITVIADKSFRINGSTIEVTADKIFEINVNDDKVISISEEAQGWSKVKGGFQFNGRPDNAPTQLVTFQISGKNLKDRDKDGAPDGVEVSVLRTVKGLGIRAGLTGLSGEVFLDGKPLGIKKDNDYGVHFTPIVAADIALENLAQVQAIELLNISPGAVISSSGNWIILESDGKYHFSDGDYLIATHPAHSTADLQKISINTGKGLDLSILNGEVVPAEGLSIVSAGQEIAPSKPDEIEQPVTKDTITEEQLHGEPLRVHCNGGESDSGESADSGVETVAEDLNAPEISNFDCQVSDESDSEDFIDLAQDSEDDEDNDVKPSLLDRIKSPDLNIEDIRYELLADLNLPEFQRLAVLAELFQTSHADSPLDAIMAVESVSVSPFKPEVEIIQAESVRELVTDKCLQPVDEL